MFLMMRVYARTREREKAWKIGGWSLGGSLVTAPFIMMIFRKKSIWTFPEVSCFFYPPSLAQFAHKQVTVLLLLLTYPRVDLHHSPAPPSASD